MKDEQQAYPKSAAYPSMNRTITQKRRRHPYQVSYNKRCLKSDCDYPSFFDGQTYFSLCLKHLETEQLGPFFNGRKYDPTEAEKFDWNTVPDKAEPSTPSKASTDNTNTDKN